MRLPLLTRGMGLAYLAFTPAEECDLIVSMLRNSADPEDRLAQSPEAVARLISVTRDQGFAVRSPEAQPRNSNTIAVPIYNEHGRVVASLGLTYFISAFPSLRAACEMYGPVLKDASKEITKDLARLNRTTAG